MFVPIQLVVIIMLAEPDAVPVTVANDAVSEIVVTGQRREQSELAHSGNIGLLDGALIDSVLHQHVHQLMTRVAGVWVSRGSGQEHLTAIRSPVLTGPGSCGAFLFLENGVPIRPAGFCNVNQLFEIDTEQETAGFIVGEDAYRDPAVNRSNPNPEAFREASNPRLYGIWSRPVSRYTVDVRPFLRRTDM